MWKLKLFSKQLMDQLLELPNKAVVKITVEYLQKLQITLCNLQKKYHCLRKDFCKVSFSTDLENLNDCEIKNAADGLQKAYPKDLVSYLYEELVQLFAKRKVFRDKCSKERFGSISLKKRTGRLCFQTWKFHCKSISV